MSGFYDRLVKETHEARTELQNVQLIRSALKGGITRQQYVQFLTQAYHHVKHTVPLLMACGSRLTGSRFWAQSTVTEYIAEEKGHDEWILSDIDACGADAQAVRKGSPAYETEIMVAYAYYQIDRVNPFSFFGMVHVLEGTSVAVASQAAAAIQASLKLPDSALTYLNSHGSLDVSHVKFFQQLMDRVTDTQDQADIIHSAHHFYRLYGDIFRVLS